jgi:hypothetical protein
MFLASLALAAAVYAAQPASAPSKPEPITFANYGFRINSLLETPSDATIMPAVQMSLPVAPFPSDKTKQFPPNVDVQVLAYPDGLGKYMTDSKADLVKVGYTLVAETKPSATEWQVEYIGFLEGTPMHWYTRAVSANNKIYVATGGMPDEMWAKFSAQIKRCVDSLQALGAAAPASSPPPLILTPVPAAPKP